MLSFQISILKTVPTLMYLVGMNYFTPQGDRGLPGPRGPRGQQGVGIKGDKVGCTYYIFRFTLILN